MAIAYNSRWTFLAPGTATVAPCCWRLPGIDTLALAPPMPRISHLTSQKPNARDGFGSIQSALRFSSRIAGSEGDVRKCAAAASATVATPALTANAERLKRAEAFKGRTQRTLAPRDWQRIRPSHKQPALVHWRLLRISPTTGTFLRWPPRAPCDHHRLDALLSRARGNSRAGGVSADLSVDDIVPVHLLRPRRFVRFVAAWAVLHECSATSLRQGCTSRRGCSVRYVLSRAHVRARLRLKRLSGEKWHLRLLRLPRLRIRLQIRVGLHVHLLALSLGRCLVKVYGGRLSSGRRGDSSCARHAGVAK